MIVRALSIRQPWAWLVLHGGKDVENRSWSTNFRGRAYIHASQDMTRREYDEARYFASRVNPSLVLPRMEELQKGGIVGSVDITGSVPSSDSAWFTGPYGFVLSDPRPMDLFPCKGKLFFFNVEIPERLAR